jgi:RHS repeat-associated protein
MAYNSAPRRLDATLGSAPYYDAPYYFTLGCVGGGGPLPSVGAAVAAWWAAYQSCWGYNCSYDETDYPDGNQTGVFAWMLLKNGCGGGDVVTGTPYSYDVGQNNGTGAGCDGGEGHSGEGGASGSGGGARTSCEDENGATSDDGVPSAGDPINTATGNKFIQEDDFTADPWLMFRRFYNSHQSASTTAMGVHWSHSFNRYLTHSGNDANGASSITVSRPNGMREAFQRAAGNAWAAAPNNPDTLTEVTDAQGGLGGYKLWVAALRHTELYSADGYLLSVKDSTGQVLTLDYSNSLTDPSVAPRSGLLLSAMAPSGRELKFAYDINGRLARVTQPDDGSLTYEYDATGNLTSVHYPDGNSRHYVYNESGMTGGSDLVSAMTGIVDENGVRYEDTSFDSYGRANSTQFAGGAGKVAVAYNADGSSDVTYPLGGVSHQAYTTVQGLFRVASVDKPCGECAQPYAMRTYDTNSRPASYTDFNGNVRVVTYDANGLLTEEIDAKGTSDQRTISTVWNTTFRVPLMSLIKDSAGKIVSKEGWDYGATGQTTASCLIDVAVAPSYTCSSSGVAPTGVRRTVYTYCTAANVGGCPFTGLLLSSDGPRTDVSDKVTYVYYQALDESGCGTLGGPCHRAGDLKTATDGMGLITNFVSYDKAGRLARTQSPNGVITDFTYTARGWINTKTIRSLPSGMPDASDSTIHITYNADGTVQKIADPDGATATYTYDAAHRLIEITDAPQHRIHYVLDAAGNHTSELVYNEFGLQARMGRQKFNALGQLMAITNGYNDTVFSVGESGYDGNGNLVVGTDGLGIKQKRVFDGLNRLVSTIRDYQGANTATANAQSVSSFDALDRFTGFSDPDGLNTTYDIDALGNVPRIHSPDTGLTSRSFDVSGNIVSSTDAANISHTSTFDADNRILTTAYADSSLNVQYRYDEADTVTGCTGNFGKGRLTRVIEGSGGLVRCYDGRGNVVKKQQTVGAATRTTAYTWTPGNRLNTVTTPNGTLVSYTRSYYGTILSIQVTPAGGTTSAVISNIRYTALGKVASYSLGDGQSVVYTYDPSGDLKDIASTAFSWHAKRDVMGNVVAIGDTSNVATPTETYEYDSLYRLSAVRPVGGVGGETYTYNKTGDRLSKTAPGTLTGQYTYRVGTHQLLGVGATARQVDARGNTTANVLPSGTFGFGYNQRNRLAVVQNGGSTVATYVINAAGQRVQKVANGITTRFDYDESGHLLGESDGSLIKDYIWFGAVPVAIVDQTIVRGRTTTSSISFVHADGLGTPRAVTTAVGGLKWQWPYGGNPFGEKTPQSTGGYVLNLRLPGQYFDAESGLSYNVNRDYEPATGRYIQSDPLGLGAGPLTYAYVGSNPLRYLDPFGLKYAESWAAGGAIAGGTIVAGGSVVVDVYSGGLNIVATGPEIAGGSAIGGGIGYVLGSALDWATGNIQQSTGLPPGYWPADTGAAEWGRRTGVGAREGKGRFHGIKQSCPGSKATDVFGVDPKTGDVIDPTGEVVGNLDDVKSK